MDRGTLPGPYGRTNPLSAFTEPDPYLADCRTLAACCFVKRLADSGEFSRLPFVEETAQQLSSCPEFPTVFRRAVEASSSKLRSEDQKLLLTLADLLGAYDLETQERGLESLRSLLEEKREEAQQNQFTNGRIALAILLV